MSNVAPRGPVQPNEEHRTQQLSTLLNADGLGERCCSIVMMPLQQQRTTLTPQCCNMAVATGEGVEAGGETGVLAEVGLGSGGGGEHLFEGGNWQDRTGGYA